VSGIEIGRAWRRRGEGVVRRRLMVGWWKAEPPRASAGEARPCRGRTRRQRAGACATGGRSVVAGPRQGGEWAGPVAEPRRSGSPKHRASRRFLFLGIGGSIIRGLPWAPARRVVIRIAPPLPPDGTRAWEEQR
jgi:hypothetical protein